MKTIAQYILIIACWMIVMGCPLVRGTGNAVQATGEGIGHAVEGTGDAIGQAGREITQ